MNTASTIILFTGSYPYGVPAEQTFLEPELKHLAAQFDRLIIVPKRLTGERCTPPVSAQIVEDYAQSLSNLFSLGQQTLLTLLSPQFHAELAGRPATLYQPSALKYAIFFWACAKYTQKWLSQFIQREQLALNSTIFYTYWLWYTTLGIGLAKRGHPQIKLVSRAHGYDLYEHRHNPPYIPYRPQTLKSLERLFLISNHGKDHIVSLFPWLASRCEVRKLGVVDPNIIPPAAADDVVRIASCSFMVPVKRLDLLCQGLQAAARLKPSQAFEWHHLGDGPMQAQVEALTKANNPANLTCHFWGRLSNDQVMAFYKDHPIDLFMNVSAAEGIPVSIMEAQCYGIPVIATAVGGTPEIISDEAGLLLSPAPTPAEIAAAISALLDDPKGLAQKRKASRAMWQTTYNADVNYAAFAEKLKSLLNSN